MVREILLRIYRKGFIYQLLILVILYGITKSFQESQIFAFILGYAIFYTLAMQGIVEIFFGYCKYLSNRKTKITGVKK